MAYNGHKNWAHWNVSLWLFNEEPLYRLACRAMKFAPNRDEAARRLLRDLPPTTPDGARYTFSAVRAAIGKDSGL